MSDGVAPEERISRFIDEKGKFRSSDLTAKYNLFMPPKSLKLSTYRTSTISEGEIWQIAAAYVEPERGKPVLARADFSAQEIYNSGLDIDPNGVPHPLHADVIDWGDDEAKIRAIALELSLKATVILKP